MVVYKIYSYIIVSYEREILICCISTLEQRIEERAISWRVEMIYIIKFHLPPYEFERGSNVNLGKLWKVKFQAK